MLVPRSVYRFFQKLEKHVISSTSFVKITFFSFSSFCEIQDLKAFLPSRISVGLLACALDGPPSISSQWMVVSTEPAVVRQELIINRTTIEWQRPGCWRIVKLNVRLQKFVMGSNSAWGAVKSGNVYPNARPVWKALVVSATVLKIKGPYCFEAILNCLYIQDGMQATVLVLS